jgi:osmotically-inducible protein OsmY
MKTHRSIVYASLAVSVVFLGAGGLSSAFSQQTPRRPAAAPQAVDVPRAELLVLSALRAHPLTAAYPISATWNKGAVVLSGRVGTKAVHDVAVQLAIASGSPIRDDLVIDTGLAHAASTGMGVSPYVGLGASSPYIYPPPLMGRLDDPFFGFVPPLVSFPPWWRRRLDAQPMQRPGPAGANPNAPPGAGAGSVAAGPDGRVPMGQNAPAAGWQPFDVSPVKGQVDITVDASGQVFMRGVVTSEEAGREIVEAARSVPGVSRVETQFQVLPRHAGGENPPPRPGDPVEPRRAPAGDVPPPPEPAVPAGQPTDQPAVKAPARAAARAFATGPSALDKANLTRRVVTAISRRPLAAELPVAVRSSDDSTVTLSGRVPTAYEAMIVYRAAQQTPGVRDVIDRLEFTVPDEDHPNPLVQKGRPEDLEPFLASQIRRHVGDLAHIDRIQAQGDMIDIRGTLGEGQDRERLLAILRSIPVLRGFRVETQLTAE